MPNRLESILPRFMCARGVAYLLASECRIFARRAQNLDPAAREQKSKAIDAAADLEVVAWSRSTGEPNLPSAARSRQPHPTEAAPPGQPALSHNILQYILTVVSGLRSSLGCNTSRESCGREGEGGRAGPERVS